VNIEADQTWAASQQERDEAIARAEESLRICEEIESPHAAMVRERLVADFLPTQPGVAHSHDFTHSLRLRAK
jgi:hypothetical protein